jgi:hypothetical protein
VNATSPAAARGAVAYAAPAPGSPADVLRQAILEEVSNLTRYLSSVAYLTAVEAPDNILAAGLYGATTICAGGLQIAEAEIPMVLNLTGRAAL